ncbi:hypothetical protein DPMN_129456 [Dreissena polymorpha]|uniref:Uncharacterized protein n=1 Tax=Dreissena polymorpha TaxID=45954 RepID=A0A9D4H4Q4_DREPO|nr:hypothetical protein DPMN_129456 [Dreissena polymorpha]
MERERGGRREREEGREGGRLREREIERENERKRERERERERERCTTTHGLYRTRYFQDVDHDTKLIDTIKQCLNCNPIHNRSGRLVTRARNFLKHGHCQTIILVSIM